MHTHLYPQNCVSHVGISMGFTWFLTSRVLRLRDSIIILCKPQLLRNFQNFLNTQRYYRFGDMADIYDFAKPYDFDSLELSNPLSKGKSGYIIKFSSHDAPVYVQPPKCLLKQGFVKSGKNMYCDLVFGVENEKFMTWLEQLERSCIAHIYKKRNDWFETEMDETEIQNYLQPIGKPYKSGRMYTIRTVVPTTLGKCDLKVYDENETEFPHENLQENMRVITILEFKGIQCLQRSFHLEIELKQMLISPEKVFDRCLIRKTRDDVRVHVSDQPVDNLAKNETTHDEPPVSQVENDESLEKSTTHDMTTQPLEMPESSSIYTDTVESPELTDKRTMDISEVEFTLDNLQDDEPIQLKCRNDVYYKMYKAARQKAKEAKIVALSNYLEAKRIKTAYFLDDAESDDDDLAEWRDMFSHDSASPVSQ